MDKFYIVRLWISDQYWDLGFCQTLDYAKFILQKEVAKRKETYSEEYDTLANCRFAIHHMVRTDQITGEVYVEAKDGDVLECSTCATFMRFRGQWYSHQDEQAYKNSNGKYCHHCYDRMMEVEKSRRNNEETN